MAEYEETNTIVLERFNTTAGNPVKKILLKLNLSDHRSILTDLKFDNHQPPETPEVTPFVESKEWIETNNELYTIMEDFMKRMNQQSEQEALLVAQREQEQAA
ncbi:hypothetical protein Tco_0855215 [Tanacetum coccineum]